MNNCAFMKLNGNQCLAKPMKGYEFCFRHNPVFKDKQRTSSQQGGLNRRLQGSFGRRVELKSPNDIKTLLNEAINAVWTGLAPVQVGTSIGFLTRCWLDAYDRTEIEKRLEKIEETLRDQSGY
jgi:hypothetical protein